MIDVHSFLYNPILTPDKNHDWEDYAALNCSILQESENYVLLYRAIGNRKKHEDQELNLSTIGISQSPHKDNFPVRTQLIKPEYPWEKYGCEDPRLTKIDDDYFIFYSALSTFPAASNVKVALGITKDLSNITEKHLVTPFNAKAMVLFPEKINGKYVALLTINPDLPPSQIALAVFDKKEDIWSAKYWKKWLVNLPKHILPVSRVTTDHVEIGAVPVKTDKGWLLIYSHIQNYFSSNLWTFGIEALLLDLEDPQKIIGRTWEPIMIPQEKFELEGTVPNVIFPSGCLVEGDQVFIYYGAADTSCALALCSLKELLSNMAEKSGHHIPRLTRIGPDPIIEPIPEHDWEAKATFNPAALLINGETHLLYRASSWDNTSTLGYAVCKNGTQITSRLDKPIYVPQYSFELKGIPGGNSGCEDPRLTQIGDKIYMCYTAYNGVTPPRVALTSILVSDFLSRRWNWKTPKLISDPTTDNKNACIMPEKVGGKYVMLHREGGSGIVVDIIDDLEFENNQYLQGEACIPDRHGWWDGQKIGISAPPMKTAKGWLLLYHGVSSYDQNYRLGALLLDLEDPTKVLSRSLYPLLEPERNYERIGVVNNVVFPCGAVIIGDNLFVYYGGADQVIGIATGSVSAILEYLS